jgi:integrase
MLETSTRPVKVPKYRLHKQSGHAIVTLSNGAAGRSDVLLGKYGTKASREEYARVIAEWEANGRQIVENVGDVTVSELLAAFWRHCRKHYRRPDDTMTSEVGIFKLAMQPMKQLYGPTPAANFSALRLKAVRQRLFAPRPLGKGKGMRTLCRGSVNRYVARIKHIFKWAVGEGLVPSSVLAGVQAVDGLERGRCDARESNPIGPVSDAIVDAIRDHVLPEVWAMIELQRLTGMRPGEVSAMRPCDLDTTGAVWVYRPSAHKMSYRGRDRVVCIGLKGQAIIKPFLPTCTTDYVFSPQRAMEQRSAHLRAKRVVPLYPSHQSGKPKRRWAERYDTNSYAHAIRRGCEAAGVPLWSPNRLRHARATEIRKRFGLEAAQVTLGHSKADVTQIYAERDLGLALKVAAECG